MSRKIDLSQIISRMRSMWIVCFGLLALMSMSGLFLNHVLVPYFAFVLMFVVIFYGNHNLVTSSVNCSLITHYTFYTLFFSGVVMIVLNLLNLHVFLADIPQYDHTDTPFHGSIVVYPIAAICFGIALLRRGKPEYCRACKAASGFSVSESIKRNVLHHESRVQLVGAFVFSLIITAIVWAYFILLYSNESVTSLDRLVLYYVPFSLYVISVIYCLIRYNSMNYEISLTIRENMSKRSQLVRFMILKGDEVYLHELASSADYGISLWDTPAKCDTDLAFDIDDDFARDKFREISHLENFDVRFLFNTNNNNQTVYHFAVFLPEDSPEPELGGEWFNLYMFNTMLKAGFITRSFAYEMHRIFTITMAWKTYSRDGKRLYPIKNYRPTFRLRDFKDWDVDYSDLGWLSVSKNNEDRPLFKLRQFWREHVSGVDKRWKQNRS